MADGEQAGASTLTVEMVDAGEAEAVKILSEIDPLEGKLVSIIACNPESIRFLVNRIYRVMEAARVRG